MSLIKKLMGVVSLCFSFFMIFMIYSIFDGFESSLAFVDKYGYFAPILTLSLLSIILMFAGFNFFKS